MKLKVGLVFVDRITDFFPSYYVGNLSAIGFVTRGTKHKKDYIIFKISKEDTWPSLRKVISSDYHLMEKISTFYGASHVWS